MSMRTRSLNKKPISDAVAPLVFSVSRRDVNKGKTQDPMSCAIAQGLSCKNGVLSVRIGSHIALVEYKDCVVRYGISKEDTRKIDAFDAARYFQPGSYMLHVPEKKLGVHTVGHKKKRKAQEGGGGTHVSRRKPTRHAWRVNEAVA